MKKLGIVFILLITVFMATACDSTSNNTGTTKATKVHEHCTRTGTMTGNAQANLNYEIYYTGEVFNKIESTEEVVSTSESILDQYEDAYKQISTHYEGLKYYDTTVTRTSNSVTYKIVIDYDRINIAQLIAIEGEEDNIFEDGVPKIKKWKELTKKVGMTCEVAS